MLMCPIISAHFTHTVEAQTQLNSASEKERSATEKFLTFQSRLGSLEEQLTSVRQERSQLVASLEAERTKLSTLEETHRRCVHMHMYVNYEAIIRDIDYYARHSITCFSYVNTFRS